MQNPEKQIDDLLQDAGAKLIRKSRHAVYRFPNGRNFITPATPSDRRWAHNSLSDLRRILAAQSSKEEESSLGPVLVPAATTLEKERVRVPNRVQHEKSTMPVLTFASDKADTATKPPTSTVRSATFDSVETLLDIVYEVDSFWELDTCGRIRVLMKLISRFARVEAIPYRYCVVSCEEKVATDHPTLVKIKERMDCKWLDRRAVCLYVVLPDGGEFLIEAEGLRKQGEDNDGIVGHRPSPFGRYAHFFTAVTEPVSSPEEEEADMETLRDLRTKISDLKEQSRFSSLHASADRMVEQLNAEINRILEGKISRYILYEFDSLPYARGMGLHYETTESWTNPTVTRTALREILQFPQAKLDVLKRLSPERFSAPAALRS